MEKDISNNLIVLTGPTAVGKTELSIELAKKVNGEIISADSIQVYKGFDVGSAKITKEEMQGICHHLIDVLEPTESFNIALFKDMAKAAVKDIQSRGKLPIITGGTGFYIQSLIYDIDFTENEDDGYRATLEKLLQEKGPMYIHNMLRDIDPKSADLIHYNNSKRVIRALEYYHQTGEQISTHNERESSKTSPYNFAYFVLNCPRDILYERIDKRVDIMVNQGLVEEVRALVNDFNLTSDMVSMQGLGYKEILQYLKGEITLDEAIYIIKRDTRHFAKRQLTWFKREKDVIWVDKNIHTTTDKQLDFITNVLKEKEIIAK
ncbi:MAG: tRNA (adenosine(37)-N6)-dimethylallyltransferase MiaA [Lachnospiraceae bacterium]|nr:tRNA (adenosine(37)-N6)-dimethylallyltransferase MiaA [Lachnospiraceae bacterium]